MSKVTSVTEDTVEQPSENSPEKPQRIFNSRSAPVYPWREKPMAETTERWKAIPGYEGRYEVSSCGRIKNLRTDYVLRGNRHNAGYREVRLFRDGDTEGRRFLVHRLVLLAFVGPAPANHVCNHLSGKKDDNTLDNLVWCTPKANAQHAARLGLLRPGFRPGVANVNAKLRESDVLLLRWLRARGHSLTRTARELGVTPSVAFRAATGRTWKHLGEPYGRRKQLAG